MHSWRPSSFNRRRDAWRGRLIHSGPAWILWYIALPAFLVFLGLRAAYPDAELQEYPPSMIAFTPLAALLLGLPTSWVLGTLAPRVVVRNVGPNIPLRNYAVQVLLGLLTFVIPLVGGAVWGLVAP